MSDKYVAHVSRFVGQKRDACAKRLALIISTSIGIYMLGIVLALFAALAFGSSVVLVRKNIDESNFFLAALVLTVTGNIILWPLALLFTNLRMVNFKGVLFFIVAGILAPGIARLGYYKGMEVVGVSVNASIFATYPVYSSILAVFLLGEALTPENLIGIVCIVVGAVYIERSLSNHKTGPERVSKKGLAFPVFASLAIALSQIFRKHGLNIYNEPWLGVAIGYSSTLLLYLPLLVSSNTTRGSTFSVRDFRMFWKAGVGMALGWILSFYALSHENVSIVAPLLQTEPLFVLFFVYIYLKKLEHISFKLFIGALSIVVGAMLVGIS